MIVTWLIAKGRFLNIPKTAVAEIKRDYIFIYYAVKIRVDASTLVLIYELLAH